MASKPRSTTLMTVSLPPEMAREVEKVRKAEHRTRSEFAREAFRTYIAIGRRTYTPTTAELRAIEKGRAGFQRGEGLTLEQARAHVERLASKARSKKRRSCP